MPDGPLPASPLNSGDAREHDGGLPAALLGRGHLRRDVLHEEHAAVVDVGLAGAEPAIEPTAHLLEDGVLLLLPLLAVGRVRELVVEGASLEPVVVEGVAEHDAGRQVGHLVEHVSRAPGDIAQHERGLAHGPGRVLELLAVGDNLGWALEVPLVVPLVELVERVADEAAGAAAAVVERADVAVVGVEERVLVREQERRGEPRHVLRRHEVLGVLRDLLAVSLDEVLVDVGHHAVGDRLGPEVEAREACAHLVEHALLIKLLAGLAHLEALQDLAGVHGEAVDVGHEGVTGLRRPEVGEREARDVVEAVAGEGAVLRVVVVPDSLGGLSAYGRPRRLEGALEAPQHSEGKDELVVVGGADDVAHVVRDAPYLINVVERGLIGHGRTSLRKIHSQPCILQPRSLIWVNGQPIVQQIW